MQYFVASSGHNKEIHDSTQNARKCVIPCLRLSGDAWYERKDSKRLPHLPRMRKALSTETLVAETMEPPLSTTGLCSTPAFCDSQLLRSLICETADPAPAPG